MPLDYHMPGRSPPFFFSLCLCAFAPLRLKKIKLDTADNVPLQHLITRSYNNICQVFIITLG
jgi:hypothetical protein